MMVVFSAVLPSLPRIHEYDESMALVKSLIAFVKIRNTEEGRKKALALITKNMRSNEAANIGIRQKKDGSYEGYVIDKNAVGKDASAGYKGVVGSHQ